MTTRISSLAKVRTLVAAMVVVLLAILWTAIAYELRAERERALASSYREGANLSQTVAAHFTAFVRNIDQWLRFARVEWFDDSAHLAHIVRGARSPVGDDVAFEMAIVGRDGRLEYSSAPGGVRGTDLSAQPYVRVHAARPRDDFLSIGDPVPDSVTGSPRIHLARPMLDRDGRFAGVIVLSLSPTALDRVYASIDLGSEGIVTLRRLEGTVLARSKNLSPAQRAQTSRWYSFQRDTREVGHFTRISTVDGIERVFSFRRMPELGLVAVVGRSLAAALAKYRSERVAYLTGGGVITALLLALLAAFATRLRREVERESELRRSEARFRSLVELSFEYFWEQDSNFRFTLIEGGGEIWNAAARERMRGRALWELDCTNMTPEGWAAHRAVLEAHRPYRDLELCQFDSAGRELWVAMSGEPLFDGGGAFSGYWGVAKNVTERKRAERLQALEHAVNRALADADNACAALQSVLRAVCEKTGWDCGEYWGVDEAAAVLRREQVWAAPDAREALGTFLERSAGIALKRGEGLTGTVWETREPVWAADLDKDPRAQRRHYARAAGLRAAFGFPVGADGRIDGVMMFPSSELRETDEGLLAAVRVVGSQVGQYLHRKAAERNLHKSEARFRSLVELSFDTYWEQDAELRFTLAKGTGPNWRVAARDELLGKRRWEVGYSLAVGFDWSAHKADLEARRPFRDLELCRAAKSGHEFWLSVSGEPVFDEAGAFKGYRGVSKDITLRKRAEQMQTLEHAVNRALAEPGDVSQTLQAVLRAVCETLGWTCGGYAHYEARTGTLRVTEFWLAPEAPEGARVFAERSREALLSTTEGLSGEVWRNGEPLWVENLEDEPRLARRGLARDSGMRGTFLFPVTAEGDTLGVMHFPSFAPRQPDAQLLLTVRVIGNEIGQYLRRKESERVLRESEARFRSLTEISSDLYWETNTEMRFTRAVGTAYVPVERFIGKTRWELPGLLWSEKEKLDFRALVEARRPFRDSVSRFVDPEGKPRYISVNGDPMYDEQGRFAGYRGTAREITDAMLREEALTRFRAAIDVSADMVVLVDPVRMRYVDVNEAACRRLGYSRDELLEMAPDEIFSQDRETMARSYARLIAGDSSEAPVEGWYRCRDGSAVPVEAVRRAVRTRGGDVIVAVARDVTARREHQRRIRERELQQSAIASFGQQALASMDVEDLMRRAVALIAETLNTEFCSLLGRAADAPSLVVKAAVGWPSETVGRPFAEAEEPKAAHEVVRSLKPVVIDDFDTERRYRRSELAASLGLRSSLVVPIPGKGGAYGVLAIQSRQPRRFDERHVAFMQSVANTLAAAIERAQAEERLTRLAQFDTVTGLPNRLLFRDRLEQVLAQARRNRWLVGVMFIDLDRFKIVNDTLGHDYGDTLLARVAERLSGATRAGDTVGRLGGDEFAVALSNLSRPDDAGMIAQKLLEALSAPFDLGGYKSYVTASVGIAVHPADGQDADSLLRNADTAMYRVKSRGRNGYQFYMPEMNDRAVERLEMENDLRSALERGEFVLHYQPKVRLRGGRIYGLEALLRWNHPQRGQVSPEDFIPLLEETGLIVPVGEWVLREVCRQIGGWQRTGVRVPPIAVNLSPRQFQQKDLERTVRRILDEGGVAPELLDVEITESLLMHDTEAAAKTLRVLKDCGVGISVDDFGTGYSSLSYLRRFPLDALKIDRSFIDDVSGEGDDASITLAIINLAHSLKLDVVAEGVETGEQLAFLAAHGCDAVQGYLVSPPLPAADCEAMLRAGTRVKPPPRAQRGTVRSIG